MNPLYALCQLYTFQSANRYFKLTLPAVS